MNRSSPCSRSAARISGLFAIAAGTVAAADVTSTFNTGNEGWKTVSYPFSGHVAAPDTSDLPFDGSTGLPPGSVRVGDVYNETGIAAPASFLGNQAAALGGTLSFDILIRFSDNVPYPAVILNAGTYSLYYTLPSTTVGEWAHRTIPLAVGEWRYNTPSGPPATPAQLSGALANLQGLYIYTEWHSGADDTNVDNIVLTGTSACYANCDGTTTAPVLTANDFQCFLDKYVAQNAYANCDGTGGLTGNDFQCFLNKYVAGCS